MKGRKRMPVPILTPNHLRAGQEYGIVWSRSGTVLGKYLTDNRSARLRAASARTVFTSIFNDVAQGDTITLSGDYDFGDDNGTYGGLDPFTFPACHYVGVGCRMRHNIQIDSISGHKASGTTGFILSEGSTTFTNMVLRQDDLHAGWYHGVGPATEDGGLICWNAICTADVTFTNCFLDGSGKNCDWLFYNWTAGTKEVTLTNCVVNYSRFGIACVDAGGLSQDINISGCRFYGNANWSTSTGESSNPNTTTGGIMAAVLNRAGATTITDSEFFATGLSAEYSLEGSFVPAGCPRIASIFADNYYSTPIGGSVTIAHSHSTILTPGYVISSLANDLDIRYATYMDGGSNTGMASGGGLKQYT